MKRVKYTLAVVGTLYAFAFTGYLIYAATHRTAQTGPSDLEAHPEKQAEVLAARRAQEMKERLGLTDEQAKQIEELHKQNTQDPIQGPPDRDKFRERMQAEREAMAKILTPEQLEKMQQMRGPGGGGRGPGNREQMQQRMQELMKKMTPEQRERMQKQLDRFQQRRNGRDRQGPGGGAAPDGPPPDGAGGPPPGDSGPPPAGS